MSVIVKDDNLRIDRVILGSYGNNFYLLMCEQSRESVLIDAPAEAGKILDIITKTNPKYILMTHNHMDHTEALAELVEKTKLPVAAHPLDASNIPVPVTITLEDNDIISFGKINLKVLYTPGHTEGSICFLTGKFLLSGDTIFSDGPGKTHSPETLSQIINSIKRKIFVLPDDTRIFPGHGPDTVLKKEKEEYLVFAAKSHDSKLCGDVLWLES